MRNPRIAGYCSCLLMLLSNLPAAPDEPIRVACIGNGITEGGTLSSSARDSYPGQLGRMLGGAYDVRNFGVDGATLLKKGERSFWNESAFENALAFQPDIVTIALGTEDSKPWNWVYRDEFIADYAAMVDTFAHLQSRPQVYACYPPPAFNNARDISDSVITYGILPMIDSTRSMTGAALIDFNSPFRSAGALFPDGIHPTIEGERLMACIAYEELTGIRIRRAADPDLAAGRPVTASGFDGDPPAGLNDGDSSTKWSVHAPGWAVIDLGGRQPVDLFQTDFGSDRSKGILYTISVSDDSTDWQTVADRTSDPDTTQPVRIDPIRQVTVRYVRLALYYGLYMNDKNGLVGVNDFHVRGPTGAVHAPLLSWRQASISNQRMRYEVLVTPSADSGEVAVIYRSPDDSAGFSALAGYEPIQESSYSVIIKSGETHGYYALAFKDGMEITSDTIRVRFGDTGTPDVRPLAASPREFRLHPNYPNPFNGRTCLRFESARPARIALHILDMRGRRIRTLAEGVSPAGTHGWAWDGTDDAGNPVPSGVYVCRLRTDSADLFQKMLLLR